MSPEAIDIRSYRDGDRDAVLALAPRLAQGVAAWRHPDAVLVAVRGWVSAALGRAADSGQAVFIAEVDGQVVGFVSVAERTHFTGVTDGYVGELVTAAQWGRRGVGRLLMARAEEWARARGLAHLTLETGAANYAAQAFYTALGYVTEDVRLTKPL